MVSLKETILSIIKTKKNIAPSINFNVYFIVALYWTSLVYGLKIETIFRKCLLNLFLV